MWDDDDEEFDPNYDPVADYELHQREAEQEACRYDEEMDQMERDYQRR